GGPQTLPGRELRWDVAAIHAGSELLPRLRHQIIARLLPALLPRRAIRGRKHSLSRQRASQRTRFDPVRLSRCAAKRRDQSQPSNGKFASFWNRDVRFAQINWFQRWQTKASPGVLRKSGQNQSRRKRNHGAVKLRKHL